MPNAGRRSITHEEPSSGRVQQRSGHRPEAATGTDLSHFGESEFGVLLACAS